MRFLTFGFVLTSTMAMAQPGPALAPAPAPAPVATHSDWNMGAGLGFTYSWGLSTAVSGLSSLNARSVMLPSATLVIERRVGDRTFITFQGAVSYSTNQSDIAPEIATQYLDVNGQVGVRRVLNPGGLVEVSWFASGRAGWATNSIRAPTAVVDPSTGQMTTELASTSNRTFGVGAVAGLALERELIEGLALRFSSSVVGVGYSLGGTSTSRSSVSTTGESHGFDVGLRFSPALEVRYAF